MVKNLSEYILTVQVDLIRTFPSKVELFDNFNFDCVKVNAFCGDQLVSQHGLQ